MANPKLHIGKEILWEESVFPVDFEDIDNSKIIEHYHELKKEDPVGIVKSNHGGYQVMLAGNRNEELDKLMCGLAQAASEIYNKGYAHKEKLVISNCWFNGNEYGDSNVLHNHPGAVLSGVYYLTDGKPEHGEITLIRPNRNEVLSFKNAKEEMPNDVEYGLSYTRSASFPAVASRALLFAPWMEHFVTTNKTQDLRIVIGLNFSIEGREDECPFATLGIY